MTDNRKKTAIILVNLGTPDEPTTKAVRAYLKEFLSDSRVIEGKGLKRLRWLAILHGIVLRFRPRKVAAAYRSIWTEDSPMRIILNQQVDALKASLVDKFGDQAFSVYGAMTYAKPGLTPLLHSLKKQGYERLLVIPLYPQYSGTTTAAIYDQITKFQLEQRRLFDLRLVQSYYAKPSYIKAIADSIRAYRKQHGSADKLLLSYHGLPRSYVDKGDPYQTQCFETSELIAEELKLNSDEWMTCFQSRFGPTEWLKPYTDKTLEILPEQGCKKIQLICPAFSADCLETLEEIAIENRDVFLEAGGEQYAYISALNADPSFINLLTELVIEQSQDWLEIK